MRRFVGIDLGREPVPDETTVCRFRHLLEKHDLGRRLFDEVQRQLMPLSQDRMREEHLTRTFKEKFVALSVVKRGKGGSGNSNSIEIRRGLGRQRGELGWHGQNIGRVVEVRREGQGPSPQPLSLFPPFKPSLTRLKSHL